MKRIMTYFSILIIFLFFQVKTGAQNNFQKEINQQVWKPFIESFSNNDTERFKSVHSKGIIRVIEDDKIIWGYSQYFPEQKTKSSTTPDQNKKTIELRFVERIADNDKAFEVGYYKSTLIANDGTLRVNYGKFHVVMRKENGIWKILVDADSGKGVTADDFNKAAVMD